jgi:hypothetical protein
VGPTVTEDPEHPQEKKLLKTLDGDGLCCPPPTTFVDFTPAFGTTYTYFVVGVFNDGTESSPATRTTSNFATKVTPSLPNLAWVSTTFTSCAEGSSPEVVVAGNAIALGVPRLTDALQPSCIHGASVSLPPLAGGTTGYQVTFSYNLFTWDSYNPSSTPLEDGQGYWDSFSVSVSKDAPYQNKGLTDPITTGNLPGLGFIWGGNRWDDALECNPSSVGCGGTIPATQTVTMPGNLSGTSYMNVVLDGFTSPESNHHHPSYGTITILNIARVP